MVSSGVTAIDPLLADGYPDCADVKPYDAVLLATLKEGMHQPHFLAVRQQLLIGVLVIRIYEEGTTVLPLLRIRRMRGVPIQPDYWNFSLTRIGMEVSVHAG